MQQLTEFQVIGHLDRQAARELGGTNPEPRVCFEVLELPALDRIFFWLQVERKSTRYLCEVGHSCWRDTFQVNCLSCLLSTLLSSYTQGPENIAHRPCWQ